MLLSCRYLVNFEINQIKKAFIVVFLQIFQSNEIALCTNNLHTDLFLLSCSCWYLSIVMVATSDEYCSKVMVIYNSKSVSPVTLYHGSIFSTVTLPLPALCLFFEREGDFTICAWQLKCWLYNQSPLQGYKLLLWPKLGIQPQWNDVGQRTAHAVKEDEHTVSDLICRLERVQFETKVRMSLLRREFRRIAASH